MLCWWPREFVYGSFICHTCQTPNVHNINSVKAALVGQFFTFLILPHLRCINQDLPQTVLAFKATKSKVFQRHKPFFLVICYFCCKKLFCVTKTYDIVGSSDIALVTQIFLLGIRSSCIYMKHFGPQLLNDNCIGKKVGLFIVLLGGTVFLNLMG